MAQQEQQQEQQPQKLLSFHKGLRKDESGSLMPPGSYPHLLNGVVNSHQGDSYTLGNEPSNYLKALFPYTPIGLIPLDGDQWAVVSTDNTVGEIGLYNAAQGTYTTIINDAATIAAGNPGFNFNTANLITGVARRNYECGFNIYFCDGARNPDRIVDTSFINPNPWFQTATTFGSCITYTNTALLDANQLRLAPLLTIPCLNLSKSIGSGTLPNGTYQVALAYAVNSIKATDYLITSNPQTVWAHNNDSSAVTLAVSGISTLAPDILGFDEMEVVVISNVNSQLSARRLGIFSTRESVIYIDNINETLPQVDIALIPVQTPAIDASDSIWEINNYLLRNGIYEKPDFNYQLLANQITARWSVVQYNEQYYRQGGSNVSYLRDEVYCAFIRWVYNTGDRSASYHIPGISSLSSGAPDAFGGGTTADGGTILGSGPMVYWQSTELYPDDKSSVWGSLCGQPIRHHKFPDQTVSPMLAHFNSGSPQNTINILGISFGNILHPVDINGVPIKNIIGYEILRGSREGNKSIVAKGMINNMRSYDIPNSGGLTGIYQNYPYNFKGPDNYLTSDSSQITTGAVNDRNNAPLTGVLRDTFSFHSPDTSFNHPGIGDASLKVCQEINGQSIGYFENPYKHPMFKTPTNFDSWLVTFITLISTLADIFGILEGSPPDIKLSGTQVIPWESPFFVHVDYANADVAGTNIIGDAQYTADIINTVANSAIYLALSVIKARVMCEQLLTTIKGLIPGVQYAAQFNSHCLYNQWSYTNAFGANVTDYQYSSGQLSSFGNYSVNNLFRNDYMLLKLDNTLPDSGPDNTLFRLQDVNKNFTPGPTKTSSWYASLKVNIPSQYGQIDSVRQIPISCIYGTTPSLVTVYQTDVLFGGDTYVVRYAEKNPFTYFNDWLVDVREDYPYDYRQSMNVPYPCYWMDNRGIYGENFFTMSSQYRHLDCLTFGGSLQGSPFYVKEGYFYLSNNGVRDFFVECEAPVHYRDWEDDIHKRFYDPYNYTNTDYLFRSDIIKTSPFYKLDYSLSAAKFWTQYVSFGQVLPREYDPNLAYTCFDYYPRRIAYSLPQFEELKRDNWRSFLANNYKDFPCPVTAIKESDKTGAYFLLSEESPMHLQGVDTIQSIGNTKITIGDGGLFNQPLQNIMNTDKSMQIGSCKSRLSAIGTPNGMFWVDQAGGKIFSDQPNKTYFNKGERAVDICKNGMTYWMAKYLPSQLLAAFPTYSLGDNPVAGVGIQCLYDNVTEVLYICKKDYSPLPGVTYGLLPGKNSSTGFMLNGVPVSLGDPIAFSDCSFTISYSTKDSLFLSYHSWIPDLSISVKNHFQTTKGSGVWQHQDNTTSFTSFYGTDYGWQLEIPLSSNPEVTTLRSIELREESYKYTNDGADEYKVKSNTWDQAVVFNKEQISNYLNLTPKTNDPYADLAYPIIGLASNQILFSQKENITRFNSFWDITNDRNAVINPWITAANGVDKSINPAYIDPLKQDIFRKKIRAFDSSVRLIKKSSGNIKMLEFFSKPSYQKSPR